MFYLTKEKQSKVDVAHLLYYPDESPDMELLHAHIKQLKESLYFIPEHFHGAILDGTLLTNNRLFSDYINWCENVIFYNEEQLTLRYEKRDKIVHKLSESGASVFSETLHDGKLLCTKRQDGQVKLLFDMCGGFTTKAIIELTFIDATESGNLGNYYIYDELIETDEGFGLRVLSGNPYEEWTIFFKDVTAFYLFRPAATIEGEQITTLAQLIEALNPNMNYFIMENDQFIEVELEQLRECENGIYVGTTCLASNLKEAKRRIYCDQYEDPYAHFSDMIPLEQLEEAALSDDQVLRIRAFNTMFELGEEAAHIVNRVLTNIKVPEHEQILMEITASHFKNLDLLGEEAKTRWLLK